MATSQKDYVAMARHIRALNDALDREDASPAIRDHVLGFAQVVSADFAASYRGGYAYSRARFLEACGFAVDEHGVATVRTSPYYEITSADVGKAFLQAFGKKWPVADFIGRIMARDVGKRVYRVQHPYPRSIDILQVESTEQRDKRLASHGQA